MKVYVLNQIGKPLMPCSCGKARRLLKDGKAKVVRKDIFTIQLLYRSNNYRQDVTLGMDAGSKYIGLSASTKKQELFSGETLLRTDIVKLLSDRATLRRNRRNRKTRYRKTRFSNRTASKKLGWFPPSAEQRIMTHIKIALLLANLLPITKLNIEVAPFDIQKLKDPTIYGKSYQEGEQSGYENVREYVLYRDGHLCQNCKGKSGDPVLQVHHIESRKTGGDAPNNLITLCKTCHKDYHDGKITKLFKRGKSFRDCSNMNIMNKELVNRLYIIFGNIHVTYGYITKSHRISLKLPKEHYNDAFCIAENLMAKQSDKHYVIKSVARHSRILHVQKPAKGGTRRSASAPKKLNGSEFMRFDKVKFNGITCFISGSSHGYACLRDIYWNKAVDKAKVSVKKLKLLAHKYGSMLVS